MGLDFDALEYCKNVKVKQSVPPYACPVLKCGRSYKTVIGLQYHLVNYDHDNPQSLTPIITPNRKKARSRCTNQLTKGSGICSSGSGSGVNNNNNNNINARCGSAGDDDMNGGIGGTGVHQITNPDSLVSYNDKEQTVTFNIDGKSVRLGIHQPLPFIEEDEYIELVERGCILNADAPPVEKNAPWTKVKVPEARYQEITDYYVTDAPVRSGAYYRFIEKSVEELDGEVEYDVDEEDSAWLQWMNEERERNGQNAVNIDTMELLMDRLEKESYFQAAANGTSTGTEVDDDAVCCICMDGECQNTNVILFCDMCNLAVHQDCYGVPYIPEGQWLCRRCLQSPSTPVNCVLCPNTGGAFKQTDRGQWAHVVCALWIPEVRFANTVFLEPIDSIETIPAARWRLTCYVCKEKGLGACIQCHRNSCYAAFHVTCAQQAGLYMTMDMNEGTTHNDSSIHVQKYAFCHAHTPEHAKSKLNLKNFEDARHKMKEARKALAKKRSSAPIVLIPTIPPERIHEISGMVHMQKKKEFLDRLIAYWTLKRKYRNGVPLLRRLQSQGNNHGVIQRNGIEGSPDTSELYRQLKYWQCLRQDLERARLLCELVRKREKLKAAYVKICEQVVLLQLNPLESVLAKLLNSLEARDTSEIFREPVDTIEVPDYLDIVTHPMDLGTMRTKLHSGQYTNLDQLQADFDLMIQNCLAYNNKDTLFYRAGIRMRDQAAPIFQQVREDLAREGLLDTNQSEQIDHVEVEVEEELQRLLASPPCEAIVQKLLILADKSQVLKNPSYRTKKIKQIRLEISRMRKTIQKAKIMARHNASTRTDDNDDIEENHNIEDMDVDTPIKHLQSYSHLEHVTPKRKRARRSIRNHIISDNDDDEDDEIETRIYDDDDDDEDEEENNDNDNNEEEDDDDDNDNGDEGAMKDISKCTDSSHTVQTPPSSPIKSLNSSASPVGVNRRTAVLFTRKAQAALKRPLETHSTPVKEEHSTITHNNNLTATNLSLLSTINNNNNSNKNNANVVAAADVATTPVATTVPATTVANSTLASSAILMAVNNKFSGGLNQLTPVSSSLGHASSTHSIAKSPKRNARHKRLSEMRNSSSMSPKKSPNRTPLLSTGVNSGLTHASHTAATLTLANSSHTTHLVQQPQQQLQIPAGPILSNYDHMPEKFRIYRTNTLTDVSDSDDDDGMSDITGSPCSSCTGFSVSGTGSDYDSSEEDDDEDDDDDDDEEDDVDEGPNKKQQENGRELTRSSAAVTATTTTPLSQTTTTIVNNNVEHMSKMARQDNKTSVTHIGDSCSGAGDCESDGNANFSDTQTRLTMRRTPTPSNKRQRHVTMRTTKQRKKLLNNPPTETTTLTTVSTPTATASPTMSTVEAETTKVIVTPSLKNNTRLGGKQSAMSNQRNNATTTTTTASVTVNSNNTLHQTPNNANSMRTRKGTSHTSNSHNTLTHTNTNNNGRSKLNNVHVANADSKVDSTQHTGNAVTMLDNVANLLKPPLEPLQLVWAKCRGYPWYPALILDPKTPKGFVYNGVPLPAPPSDVLALRKNYPPDMKVFLVLFFDVKRTWQWLPANKLEILGIDKELDQQKLIESRKPTERKAVKKAYQDALHYQSQVSDLEGQGPDPIM